MNVPTGNPLPREDWLAQIVEDAIEPEMPIIDAHHHLWMKPYRYLLDEFLADAFTGHNIRATVYVEAMAMHRPNGPEALRPLGEVEFANGMGAMAASGAFGDIQVNAAIVGFADLLRGSDVASVLEALQAAAPDRFRGIRQLSTRDAAVRLGSPAGLLLAPEFQAGFGVLQDKGLHFDAWLYHSQLSDLIALMERFPTSRVTLNHIGGRIGVGVYAEQSEQVNQDWARKLTRLAQFPNLTVKIGGLGMALCGFRFHEAALPPTSDVLVDAWSERIRTVIDIFGAERCMFESNFPVDKASCSYAVLWNAFKKLTANYSAADRERLFSGTASAVYQIQ